MILKKKKCVLHQLTMIIVSGFVQEEDYGPNKVVIYF
mgnify:CR=1 FL=1